MRVGRYIQKRGDAYRFRARLPRGLLTFLGRSEISVPRAVRDRRTALRRARVLRVTLETLMIQLSVPNLTRSKAEALVRLWIDTARDACERGVAETGTAFFTRDEVAGMGVENAQEMDALLRLAFEQDVAPDIKTDVRRGLARGLPEISDLTPIVADVQKILAPGLAPDSADGRFLAHTILRGVATLIDEKRAIVAGDPTPIAAAKDLPRPTPPTQRRPPFLSYWKQFSQWKIEEGDWTLSSAANASATPRLLGGLADPEGRLRRRRSTAASSASSASDCFVPPGSRTRTAVSANLRFST